MSYHLYYISHYNEKHEISPNISVTSVFKGTIPDFQQYFTTTPIIYHSK